VVIQSYKSRDKIRGIFNTNNDVMPLNANDFDLLKYASKASPLELDDFGLTQKVKDAQEKLTIRLHEALALLDQYRITIKDLENLILQNFKKKSEKMPQTTKIICPKCGNEFAVEDVISKQIEEKYRAELNEKITEIEMSLRQKRLNSPRRKPS